MLEGMIAALGAPVSRATLAAMCDRSEGRTVHVAVDSRISTLRKKLGEFTRAPRLIVTVPRVGYAIPLTYVVGGRDREGAG